MKHQNASKVINCIDRWNRVRQLSFPSPAQQILTKIFSPFRNNSISSNSGKWGPYSWKDQSELAVRTIFLRVQVLVRWSRIHLLPIPASVKYSQAWMTMFTGCLSFPSRDTSNFVTFRTSSNFSNPLISRLDGNFLLRCFVNMIYHKQQLYAAIEF